MRVPLLCVVLFVVQANSDLLLAGSATGWQVVVDGVMGGRSSAAIAEPVGAGGPFTFSGSIDLNGGGFASIRRTFSTPVDMRPYAGLVVRYDVRAPTAATGGRAPLALRVSLRQPGGYWGFSAAFAVPAASSESDAGGTGQAFVPLAAFTHGSRSGWSCSSCTFDPSTAVSEIDLYVMFQEGSFSVRLHSITAVVAPQGTEWDDPGLVQRLGQPGAVEAEVQRAVARGAPLFDKGYPELCHAVYASAARTIAIVANSTGPVLRQVLCRALEFARGQTANDANAAWGLRRAFDAVPAAIALGGTESAKWSAVAAIDQSSYPAAVQGDWLYDAGSGSACSSTPQASASVNASTARTPTPTGSLTTSSAVHSATAVPALHVAIALAAVMKAIS
jgi:hypothetical protein